MCIRHQTTSKPTYCLPPMHSLLHALARLFSFFFFCCCIRITCLQTVFDVEHRGTSVCLYTEALSLSNIQINPQVIIASGISTLSRHQYTASNEENPSRGLGWQLFLVSWLPWYILRRFYGIFTLSDCISVSSKHGQRAFPVDQPTYWQATPNLKDKDVWWRLILH